MGVKQYGSALGHKLILSIYNILGYRVSLFILNFIAFYYALFTPSVRQSLKSYYEHLGIELTFFRYFLHIRSFAKSIFDRFVSRIREDELTFKRENREDFLSLKDGGIVLLSHIGGWATAANSLKVDMPQVHIVMMESQKEKIKRLEREKKRQNEQHVNIIDLSEGPISANIQIANALMNKEIVAMMADRVIDKKNSIEVEFLNDKVLINKNPFEIASRFNKKIVATFSVNDGVNSYKLIFKALNTENKKTQDIAQEYMNIVEQIVKKYPNQWYNFYDFFNQK